MLQFNLVYRRKGNAILLGIKVEKSDGKLIINWQLSKIEIPIKEINDVLLDPYYGGQEKNAVKLGFLMALRIG